MAFQLSDIICLPTLARRCCRNISSRAFDGRNNNHASSFQFGRFSPPLNTLAVCFRWQRLRVLGTLISFSSYSSGPGSFIFIESGKKLLYQKTYKEFTPHFKSHSSRVRHIGILLLVIEAVVRRLPWKERYDLSPPYPREFCTILGDIIRPTYFPRGSKNFLKTK